MFFSPFLKRSVLVFMILFTSAAFLLSGLPTAYCETRESENTPWSGYWWPFRQGGLATGADYRGHPSPLEKYDMLVQGYAPGVATSWYMDNYYDPEAPYWWGECGDWAQASVYENIMFFPSSEDNIVFRVGDKKGLLTLAHSNDIAIREDGSKPEVFHYWLLHYIKEQKKSFVADLDPGEQVWSYPIFKYDMLETRNGDIDSVTVTIYYADDMVSPDYVGTKVNTQTYTYDLLLDQEGQIISGQWTGDSVTEHPDELTFPLVQRSSNPYLDYQELLDLANERDDFLENGEVPTEVGPGTYHLVLMDQDVYELPCSAGDLVTLYVGKEPGSAQDIDVIVKDVGGSTLQEATISDDTPTQITFTADNPPYYVHLSQDDYTDPNIYTLKVDIRKSFSQEVPYIPKNGMWSGFALANVGDASVGNVMLVTYKADGDPIQTVMGPVELKAGEKRVFFFQDLPWRTHEYPDTERVVLLADGPVQLLNLFGGSSSDLAALVQHENRGMHLVIPDVMLSAPGGDHMGGAIINESSEQAQLTIRVLTQDGTVEDEMAWTLGPGEMLPIDPGNYPFYNVSWNGWLYVESDSTICGYERINSADHLESIFGLPISSNQKIVPHVASPQAWRTTMTIINPNPQPNEVKIHPSLAGTDQSNDVTVHLSPWEKKEIDLGAQYGRSPGAPLYHSLLELDGDLPFVGYYTYASINGDADEGSLPLIDHSEFHRTLILPHYSRNNQQWWTGIGIGNPSGNDVTVRIEPYSTDGNLIEDLVSYESIEPGGYKVMLGTSLWGSRAQDVSFAKFVVEQEQGYICGFYLYGNRANGQVGSDMLAGANME